jgi:HIV Tat-specific factor 1
MSLRNPDARAAPDEPISAGGAGGAGAGAGGFPQDPSEFDSDPRISFSKLDNKFILETEDGQEFEYDSALKRWVQAVCIVIKLEERGGAKARL